MRRLVLWALLLPSLAGAAVGGDCTWRDPGAEPYTGSRHAAVMSFDHIRFDQRLLLSLMVQHRPPSDVVAIGRDGIHGARGYSYDASVNGMHFGRGRRCGTVTRDGWDAGHTETARAWCRGRWCVLVPDVCGNVFWTVRDQLPAGVLREATTRSVPEPGALWLVLAGLAAAAFITWRSRAHRGDDDDAR